MHTIIEAHLDASWQADGKLWRWHRGRQISGPLNDPSLGFRSSKLNGYMSCKFTINCVRHPEQSEIRINGNSRRVTMNEGIEFIIGRPLYEKPKNGSPKREVPWRWWDDDVHTQGRECRDNPVVGYPTLKSHPSAQSSIPGSPLPCVCSWFSLPWMCGQFFFKLWNPMWRKSSWVSKLSVVEIRREVVCVTWWIKGMRIVGIQCKMVGKRVGDHAGHGVMVHKALVYACHASISSRESSTRILVMLCYVQAFFFLKKCLLLRGHKAAW